MIRTRWLLAAAVAASALVAAPPDVLAGQGVLRWLGIGWGDGYHSHHGHYGEGHVAGPACFPVGSACFPVGPACFPVGSADGFAGSSAWHLEGWSGESPRHVFRQPAELHAPSLSWPVTAPRRLPPVGQ